MIKKLPIKEGKNGGVVITDAIIEWDVYLKINEIIDSINRITSTMDCESK